MGLQKSSYQSSISYEQWRLKKKQALEKKTERKAKAKLRHAQSQLGRKKLKKQAEALLHELVRKQARDFSNNVLCYTCRKTVPYEKTNASHFRHGKLDLDSRNLKACCVTCNLYKSGELGWYAIHLIEEFGKEWVDQLNQDADKDTGQYSYDFLIDFITNTKEQLKQLK